ncbi:EAL domain-containing protein [Telluria mixta]|uniref:EAL domain-containing protein n=1 Tax=Telluria mixta TaxID=34071 RepID=A0ABT2C1F8_9BURK|nr:EAL domain-containing protein [Telluria mixta]MCS0631218.1 EAL domain-containing protein [Telluria mixta]WEM95757.1 EAL domain-containing protein [Telluria mixta]
MFAPITCIGGIWTTDRKGICVSIAEHSPGLLPSPVGKSFVAWLQTVQTASGCTLAEEVAGAMDREKPFRHEHQLMCTNGNSRWVVSTGIPQFDRDGNFEGFSGALTDISEHKGVLERTLRSEAEHRLIMDNCLDLIGHCDASGNYVHVSRSYTVVVGWESEEMVGRSVLAFLHPEDQERARNALARILDGEELAEVIEVRKRHRDNRYILLGTKVRKVTDPDTGAIAGAVLVSRDITREKEMLARIERMAEQNTALIEHSLDITMLLDLEGTILHTNRAVEQVLGYRPDELIGSTGRRFMTEQGYADALGQLKLMVTGPGNLFISDDCLSKDGRTVRLDWSLCHPEGSRLVYATARDVTNMHRTKVALEQAHAQVHTILESIEDGFFSVDRNWEITFANTIAAAFVGIDREASLGKVLWDIADGLADTSVAANLRRAMEMRENMSFEVYYEPAGVWLSERVYAHEDGLSVFFHDISERKHAEARLEQLATRDVLTGLPNRASLNQHVETMLCEQRAGAVIAVLFIDLNRFKEVNDSMGHAAGDCLLKQVSARLQSCMRPGDVVARLGGDEFVVAATCTGRDATAAIAQRLIAALTNPFYVDVVEICVGASIGISLSDQDVETVEQLFQNADTAMYKAKATGESTYQFFEPEMSAEAKRRLQLEVTMRRALELGQFEIHYQPRVDLHGMRLRGMEALLRWNHPELGQISPLEFIPIAEERGHIEAIGAWVLRAACREGKRLCDKYGIALHVSVNVSARQLRHADFVLEVERALGESGLRPAALELELTESALIEDTEQSALFLRRLKGLGATLSLDDFGTGYSSLSYLKRFPVDVLKLDRSFFDEQSVDHGNAAFVEALIGMAHALDLTVVAEGIETTMVMDMLRLAGCDEAQGYVFAKPMSLHTFEEFLQSAKSNGIVRD